MLFAFVYHPVKSTGMPTHQSTGRSFKLPHSYHRLHDTEMIKEILRNVLTFPKTFPFLEMLFLLDLGTNKKVLLGLVRHSSMPMEHLSQSHNIQ
jgi:hypothetical protein